MTVRAGCVQHLPSDHPFALTANDVMQVVRVLHNSFVYNYRQAHFAYERCRRERSGSNASHQLPPLPRLSFQQLKGLVRGTHHLDVYGRPVKDDPDAKKASIALLGQVWDRIDYDFKHTIKSHRALLTLWHNGGRVGPEPGLPDYHRSDQRSISYRADIVRFSPDGTLLTFPKAQYKGVTPLALPDLAVPEYVQRSLKGGMAKLVEVQLQPSRSGGVSVQWTLDETGRDGVPFPDAPTTLAEALELGPVGSVDIGVSNLLALTITDLHQTGIRTPNQVALPGPVLVRGAALEGECHRTGMRVDAQKKRLPFLPGRGGPGKNISTAPSTSSTSSPSAKRREKRTTGRRQARTSHAINATWGKHRLRKTHLVHAAVQPVLQRLKEAGARALVVGWNEGIKQQLNLGRAQNRRFGTIPYEAIRTALQEGCQRHGILYLEVGEAYTSKTSFADGELPAKQSWYAGRRASRGLFQTGSRVRVNADVNGSLQILARALHDHSLYHLLTPALRDRVVRANLNPTSVHPNLGARTKKITQQKVMLPSG